MLITLKTNKERNKLVLHTHLIINIHQSITLCGSLMLVNDDKDN